MKKTILVICFSTFALFSVNTPAEAQSKLGFKLTGGFGYFDGGEMNKGLQGWSDIWKEYFNLIGISTSGGYEPFHQSMDLNIEFIFPIARRFFIGIGSGYLQTSKASELLIKAEGTTYKNTWSPKINAIAFNINCYYYLIDGNKVKVSLYTGAGYYLGKYEDNQQGVFFGDIKDEYKMSTKGFGVNGGIGFELVLFPPVSFLIEARGRYTKLSSFEGDLKSSWLSSSSTTTGKLWYYEVNAFGIGTFPVIALEETKPEGVDIFNVHEAKVNFNSFSIGIGLILRF